MTRTEPGQLTGLEGAWRRYLVEMAELRLTLEQNLSDYAFDKVGGRIVYLFDASIIQIFLNPTREARHFAVLGQREDQPGLAASSIAAAEFMFSRRLSGQNDAPAYLTAGHAEDVNNIVGRIGDRISSHRRYDVERQSEPRHPGLDRDVRSLLDARREGKLDEMEAVRRLGDLVPQLASKLFDEHVQEAQRFHRLLDQDLIRPLRLLPAATREVLSPDQRVVSAWMRLVRTERNRLSSHRSGRSGEPRGRALSAAEQRELRNLRDAESLAQLVLLNDAAAEQSEAIRYVLVTTDRSMWRAYTRWFFTDERAAPSPDLFALRRPTQYLPILNADQMAHGEAHSELIRQVRDVADSLLQVARGGQGDYFRTLAAISLPDLLEGEDALPAPDLRLLDAMGQRLSAAVVNDVRGRWSAATQGAILLNSHLLNGDLEQRWDGLTTILERGQLRRGVRHYLDEVLEGLEEAHAAFVSDGFMGMARAFGFSPPETDPVPLLFKPLRMSKHVYALSAIDADVIAELGLGGSESDPPERQNRGANRRPLQHAALVAFRLRQHATAMRFCKRAVAQSRLHAKRGIYDLGESRDLEAERHELYYLEAVVARHVGKGEEAERTLSQLAESLDFFAADDDLFAVVRTRCEQAALRLMSVLTAVAASGSKGRDHSLHALREFLEAADCTAHAMRQARPLVGDDRSAALLDLLHLIALRVLLLDRQVFRTKSLDRSSAEDVISAATEHLEAVEPKAAWSPRIEILAARLLFGIEVDKESAMARLVERLRNARREAIEPSSGFMADLIESWLPEMH